MNPFAADIAAAQAAALAWASEPATYVRSDGEEIRVDAGSGLEQQKADGERTTLQAGDRDFFVATDQLVTAAGDAFEPETGDRVVIADAESVFTYELVPRRGGIECFRPRDPARTQLRLHTQLAHREALP